MRLEVAAEEFQTLSGLAAAPILKAVGDDPYCVDAAGAIHRYDHERNTLEPAAMDFWALLDREVGELKTRKLRKAAQS